MLNRRADKQELLKIVEAVGLEKSIDKELIIDAMENGIAKAAKSKFGSENEIKVLINSNYNPGNKSVQWNATKEQGEPVSAGVYFYRIQAGNFVDTKKMVLLK